MKGTVGSPKDKICRSVPVLSVFALIDLKCANFCLNDITLPVRYLLTNFKNDYWNPPPNSLLFWFVILSLVHLIEFCGNPRNFACHRRLQETIFKGSRQPESRGVWNMSNCPNLPGTAAIGVRFSVNFAVVFDFIYFRFRPSKSKWIGIVVPIRRNAASFFRPL